MISSLVLLFYPIGSTVQHRHFPFLDHLPEVLGLHLLLNLVQQVRLLQLSSGELFLGVGGGWRYRGRQGEVGESYLR